MQPARPLALIGYSGHAYVAAEALRLSGAHVAGYCEAEAKALNPLNLAYLGAETHPDVLQRLRAEGWAYFVAVGDNALRQRIATRLAPHLGPAAAAIHPSAVVSPLAHISPGALVSPRAVLNALATVAQGAIINTGAVVEHECQIDEYAHIAPGAVLCGNVHVGAGTLVGAGAVARPGVRIGAGVVVGAGAVIVKDIPDGARVIGNPARVI